jgi:hypothetical protein
MWSRGPEIYVLEPNKMLRIDAAGPVGAAPDNTLEIESNDDSITVWGWGGPALPFMISET